MASKFGGKLTRKYIRGVWEQYMKDKCTSAIAPYDKQKHRILDSGSIVVLDNKYGREVIEEVGMDYGTFRVKFNTSDNPTWD